MSITKTGKEVLGNMTKEYGSDKGKEVFYASINKGNSGSEDWHGDGTVLGKRKKRKYNPVV